VWKTRWQLGLLTLVPLAASLSGSPVHVEVRVARGLDLAQDADIRVDHIYEARVCSVQLPRVGHRLE
jgi:hypothetical protein